MEFGICNQCYMLGLVETQKSTGIVKVHGPTNRQTSLFPMCLRVVLRLGCLFGLILIHLFHKAKFGAKNNQAEEIYQSRKG